MILNYTPSLNIQFDNFSNILKLYNNRNKQSVITKSKCVDTLSNKPCEDPSEHPPSPHMQINTSPSCPALNVVTSHPDVSAETLEKILASPNIKDSEEGMPDFEAILLHFGINYKKLRCIPLKNYHWWTFDSNEPELASSQLTHIRGNPGLGDGCVTEVTSKPRGKHTSNETQEESGNMSPTISQRVKLMARRARRTQSLTLT